MKIFVTEPVFERTGGLSLMFRVKLRGGVWANQDSFDTITLKVFSAREPEAPVNGGSGEVVDPNAVFFNALRTTDPVTGAVIWFKDAGGFNFLYNTKASQLPKGGEKYVFEFICSKDGIEPLPIAVAVPTLCLYSA